MKDFIFKQSLNFKRGDWIDKIAACVTVAVSVVAMSVAVVFVGLFVWAVLTALFLIFWTLWPLFLPFLIIFGLASFTTFFYFIRQN